MIAATLVGVGVAVMLACVAVALMRMRSGPDKALLGVVGLAGAALIAAAGAVALGDARALDAAILAALLILPFALAAGKALRYGALDAPIAALRAPEDGS
ncbi:MAG: hypothetical protein NW203_15090 [Hyphomonadaceae bacterium]|nr:hypothetical protein [Hyphomonadaceae bacterium]